MTNGDKIRQMSNEELAKLWRVRFCEACAFKDDDRYEDCVKYRCEEGIKAYLDMEVEE